MERLGELLCKARAERGDYLTENGDRFGRLRDVSFRDRERQKDAVTRGRSP
jgi:hypothetical protein